jgi:hypothetical protein
LANNRQRIPKIMSNANPRIAPRPLGVGDTRYKIKSALPTTTQTHPREKMGDVQQGSCRSLEA